MADCMDTWLQGSANCLSKPKGVSNGNDSSALRVGTWHWDKYF